MSLKFTPVMFSEVFGSSVYGMAEQAQKIFDEWLKAQVVVQVSPLNKDGILFALSANTPEAGYTRRARLVCIEEIEEKPCEHEGEQRNISTVLTSFPPQSPKLEYVCKHCGVKLKAKWELAE